MRSRRYTTVAIALHWLIALSIVSLILVGWWMGEAIEKPETRDAAYAAFQLHKAFGITVLVLTLARLVWRLMNPPPPMSSANPAWERFAAKAVHAAFYALSIGIPLAGLVYVSAGWSPENDRPFSVATSYFGLFTVPHLPFIEAMAPAARRSVAFMSMNAHGKMAWGVIVLLALHVGAALKHQFIDRDDVLAGMVPGLKLRGEQGEPARDGAAPFVVGVAAVLALGLATALAGAPSKPFPKPVEASAPQVAPAPVSETLPEEKAEKPGVEAPRWTVDPRASAIEFSGVHAGKDFKGVFDRWTADIRFDPAKLDASRVSVSVDVGSAHTGDATKDSSMKESEWFDPARFPKARFVATRFKALGESKYEAQGRLTIKDKTIPVTLPFTLDLKDDEAKMRAKLSLDRIALGLGVASDPTADWVSRAIEVDIRVEAERAK